MRFLETSSGLVAAKAIVLIGGLNTRPTGNFHLIEYCVGSEPRTTRATQEAVQVFLDDQP